MLVTNTMQQTIEIADNERYTERIFKNDFIIGGKKNLPKDIMAIPTKKNPIK